MIIANAIYDVVFKYLLEDRNIAKQMLKIGIPVDEIVKETGLTEKEINDL